MFSLQQHQTTTLCTTFKSKVMPFFIKEIFIYVCTFMYLHGCVYVCECLQFRLPHNFFRVLLYVHIHNSAIPSVPPQKTFYTPLFPPDYAGRTMRKYFSYIFE